MPKKTPWTWKVDSTETSNRLKLLYEPGNWGDILKGLWAVTAVRERIHRERLETLRYLDPFAGSPVYPLVQAARERLSRLPSNAFQELQADYAGRDEVASTALLVASACRHEGVAIHLDVFDLEAQRQEAWKRVPGAHIVEYATGEEALESAASGECHAHLILVDPYDFLSNWGRLLPLAVEAARKTTVLVYLYNRAPRGGGHKRAYDAFRRGCLDELKRRAVPVILGRLPSDAALPRAYHEVLLLGEAIPYSREALRCETVALARALAESSAFEQLG
jgi:hypothetical protein